MKRPAVGVIGAGRVGSVVAARLRAAGHEIVGVSARSDASRLRAATMLPDVPVLDPADVARRSEVLVLAVPDDALVALSEQLAGADAVRPGTVVAHTSGRHGLGALEALTRRGARPLALHPAMTFTGGTADLERTCVWGLTAADTDRDLAADLVQTLGGTVLWVDEADRVRYHAALAHGANHLTTLVAQSLELLRGIGHPAEGTTDAGMAAEVLRPLLEAALANALELGDAALTGPVARGDVTTVRAHVEALAEAPASTQDAYEALAQATAGRAEADGRLSAEAADAVREATGGGAGLRAADGSAGGAGLRAADGSAGGAGLRAADSHARAQDVSG
ncbi:Rossmann-like and DUF2520 domain-containing protein [Aeromicrobium sp. CTD01-1L150]|uniref:Rossmann-like and DUF2520 domain-containing protein n=1 Tax=Aeromicrobium sp. CTD01-1L150 TaxID=3341830 RepID=UPI0035BFCD70